MILNCLLVDDEPLAHRVILKYAEDVPYLQVVAQSYLATEALHILQSQPIDLLFLDIKMPKLSGLDFLRTLHRPPLVIITSAYEEYALAGYELRVCDYLLKPFSFERFLQATQRAWELHQLRQPPALAPAPQPEAAPLFIKVDRRTVRLEQRAIRYLESYGNYVKVWTESGFQLTPRTLASFEAELTASAFVRIHKSYLVHMRYLDFVEGNQLALIGGPTLPIGKQFRAVVRSFLAGRS